MACRRHALNHRHALISLGNRRGRFGEEYFTLFSTYFQGQPPKSVNFYWRRFRVADIPLGDAESFERWLRDRWHEKDALIEQYLTTGRFPSTPAAIANAKKIGKDGFIETEVRTRNWWEFMHIFAVVGTAAVALKIFTRVMANLVRLLARLL